MLSGPPLDRNAHKLSTVGRTRADSARQVCPLDVVKTRLQGQVHAEGMKVKYRGTVHTLRRICRDEGMRGLYRGLSPTLMGMIPTWATYFTSYNLIKRRLEAAGVSGLSGEKESLVHTISACGAGCLTATATNPIWVVKTRIQMTPSSTSEYNGTAGAVTKIFRSEGWMGFYKGLGPSLLGVSHITIQFPLYEYFKKKLSAEFGVTNIPHGESNLSISLLVASAAASKILASIFTYPHEVVRTRMYVQENQSCGMVAMYKGVFREGGVQALYRGFATNAFRVVPASAVTFVSYELVYDWLVSVYGGGGKSMVEHKVCFATHNK